MGVPVYCHFVASPSISLFQVVCPFHNGYIGPVLEVCVEAAKEVTRDNFLVCLHRPTGSWDTARQGGYWFFIFCRGGPCPPGAYNLAGETQLIMHTYTISTISDYHNIDHNCVRPGKSKISEGLGAQRRCFGKDGIRLLVE